MDTPTELFTRATELIDSVTALVTDSPVTYLLIFGLAAFDVLFPILPSEATVTAAAVLAGTGQLTLVWVILAAGLGAFVGDNIAYWIGRLAGRPLVTRILRGETRQIDGVQEQFRVRGGLFIIVGRFIPGGRTAVAIGAGVLHFRWARFVAYDALAAAIWAVQVSLPGYIGGVVVQDRPWLALVIGFALSMAVAASIALTQRWWDRRRGRAEVRLSSEADADEGVSDGGNAADRAEGAANEAHVERSPADGREEAGDDEPADDDTEAPVGSAAMGSRSVNGDGRSAHERQERPTPGGQERPAAGGPDGASADTAPTAIGS